MNDRRQAALAELTGRGGRYEIGPIKVAGRTLRGYVGAPPTLLDVWLPTEAHGDRTFLVYGEERITYTEVHTAVRRIANHLATNGVRKGDRVAIAMRNYPEWVISFWAAQTLGAIVVSVNAWWTADEVAYALTDSGVTALIVDGERYERLANLLAASPIVTVVTRPVGRVAAGHAEWRAVLQSAQPTRLAAPQITPDDDCTILYTSGTTGTPKGAVASHRNHITNVTNMLLTGELQAIEAAATSPPSTPHQPVILWTYPLFHIAGATACCVYPMIGATVVLQHKFDAAEALELVERERVSVIAGVPTVVRSMLDHPDAAARDLTSLAGISTGGAPVPPDTVTRVVKRLGSSVSAFNGYGLTETTSGVIVNTGTMYRRHPESVGTPVPVADIRIVDESGADVAPEEVGEILVRGPNVVRGYWNKPAETSQSFIDGWFRTGDAGRVDEDGMYYVVDRLKDVVIRGGENVYCAEVEATAFAHPAVADVAVFGVPDDRLGEQVAAAVVLKAGKERGWDDLREHLRRTLADYKVPTKIFLRIDALPRNAAGKVLKSALREEYAERESPGNVEGLKPAG